MEGKIPKILEKTELSQTNLELSQPVFPLLD